MYDSHSQGAPSTIRCIKTARAMNSSRAASSGQGAPSTIKCIKIQNHQSPQQARIHVREHPAPSGALRLVAICASIVFLYSRQGAPSTIRCIKTAEHRRHPRGEAGRRQGAPSTIRCIKTEISLDPHTKSFRPVWEHPAPSGALRLGIVMVSCTPFPIRSGSTQHHQVH